jgi:hypothetical protein
MDARADCRGGEGLQPRLEIDLDSKIKIIWYFFSDLIMSMSIAQIGRFDKNPRVDNYSQLRSIP